MIIEAIDIERRILGMKQRNDRPFERIRAVDVETDLAVVGSEKKADGVS